MEELHAKLNRLLATVFTMYLKTHQFHWNVTGQDFFQYHDFFGDLYGDLWGSVDKIAEEIRAAGGIAHGSLAQYKENSVVADQLTVPSLQDMVGILYRDNETVISMLNDVHQSASALNQYGLINFIEDRLDTHKKHSWMLRSAKVAPVAVTSTPAAVGESIEVASLSEDAKTYILNFKSNK